MREARCRSWFPIVRRLALLAALGLTAPAPAAAQLAGDCDQDGTVEPTELITLLDIALGLRPLTDCDEGDLNLDQIIDAAEILAAVNASLCAGTCPTPTPSPTRSPTFTPTPAPTALGSCGNGVLEANEQCDPPVDGACPGLCRPAAAPAWTCVVCGAPTGSCSGASDPSCGGQCISTSTACTCASSPPAACPPATAGSRSCDPACAQIGARLYYREEVVGSSYFAEREIELTGFPDPAQPFLVSLHVRETGSNAAGREFDTQLGGPGGSGIIVTPAGAAGAFTAGLGVYEQLVCGWPIACTGVGDVVIPNGTTYRFSLDVGAGQTNLFTFSCAGCGGGAERVNTIWSGARCGEISFLMQQDLCAGDNLTRPALAPVCCGCPGEVCPASVPSCVAGTCQ